MIPLTKQIQALLVQGQVAEAFRRLKEAKIEEALLATLQVFHPENAPKNPHALLTLASLMRDAVPCQKRESYG